MLEWGRVWIRENTVKGGVYVGTSGLSLGAVREEERNSVRGRRRGKGVGRREAGPR